MTDPVETAPEPDAAAASGSLEALAAERRVGELRYRGRGNASPPDGLVRMVGSVIALEVELSAAPERATEAAVARFLEDVLSRRTTDRDNILARGRELGADLGAGAEALLAANVAEAGGHELLAFEETGSYRLLLSAMSEDPAELERFYSETIAPLADYDDQYETALLLTLEAYLDFDGSVAGTAQRLFTHRHTIRYRLERVRELTGFDVGSSDGRQRLGLGLKAMRVLGFAPPAGPATERGAEAGRLPRQEPNPQPATRPPRPSRGGR